MGNPQSLLGTRINYFIFINSLPNPPSTRTTVPPILPPPPNLLYPPLLLYSDPTPCLPHFPSPNPTSSHKPPWPPPCTPWCPSPHGTSPNSPPAPVRPCCGDEPTAAISTEQCRLFVLSCSPICPSICSPRVYAPVLSSWGRFLLFVRGSLRHRQVAGQDQTTSVQRFFFKYIKSKFYLHLTH